MHNLAKLSLLLCAAPAAAQGFSILGASSLGQAPTNGPYLNTHSVAWSGWSIPAGQVTRTLAAALTGHVVPDVVAVKGGTAILMAAPGIHRHAGILPGLGGLAINDVAVLKGAGGHASRDALALATPNGLKRWSIGNTGIVTLDHLYDLDGWDKATLVDSHPATPDVFFGVDRQGEVMILEDLGGGTFSTTTIPGDGAALDIECIDWNGDGVSELAVLSPTSLRIYWQNTSTPTVITTFSSALSGAQDIARVVPYGGGAAQTLAWLNGTASHVFLFNSSGTLTPVALPTPNLYVAINACKAVIYEPHDALYLMRQDCIGVTVLGQNSSNSFVYSASGGFQVAVSASGTSDNPKCAPAVMDLDADGDSDLVAVLPAPSPGTSVQHTVLKPRFFARQQAWMDITLTTGPTVPPAPELLEFTVPGVLPGTMTEVTVWVTQNGALVAVPFLRPAPVPHAASHTFSFPLSGQTFQANNYDGLYVMVRPVLQSGGQVVAAGEPSLFELTVTLLPPQGGNPWQIIIPRETWIDGFPPPPVGFTPQPN